MKFKSIKIENFRSFKLLEINLSNSNVIFGVNDIGKTNLLYAMKYLLDRKQRNSGFKESDFYNKEIDKSITIALTLDISDEDNDDCKKIYSKIKGIPRTGDGELLLQLKSIYNEEHLIGEIEMYWGRNITSMIEMPRTQQSFEIDKIFNVVFIDSSIQIENVFKRYTRELFRSDKSITTEEKDNLKKAINDLNEGISKIKSIKELETNVTIEYNRFRKEDYDVKIKSEIQMDNVYSKLIPYMSSGGGHTFPTSGDGRKKIMEYSLLTMESRKNEESKINVFLVEELENHLHRSMQISLSHQLFDDGLFKYLFMTTHSAKLLNRMDNVNLIKLYMKDKPVGESYYYEVDEKYKKIKGQLNENLCEAIFEDKVLLVEGPSEVVLFKRILDVVEKKYECYGKYILPVDGIGFKEYRTVLNSLGVKTIIKTDNDLKYYETTGINLLGLNRCKELLGLDKLENEILPSIKNKDDYKIKKKIIQKAAFRKYKTDIQVFESSDIYLSKIDLENDLYSVVQDKLDSFITTIETKKSPIEYLQTAKMLNMIEFTQFLDDEGCKIIYQSKSFECLRKLVE